MLQFLAACVAAASVASAQITDAVDWAAYLGRTDPIWEYAPGSCTPVTGYTQLANTIRYGSVDCPGVVCSSPAACPDEAASVLRTCAGRCGHFIFCSTVCTYGNTQTVVPTTEDTPQAPHSEYGRNKLACEKLFLRAHAEGEMPVTIIRPSHTYGPGGGIINNLHTEPSFLARLRAGRPVIVSGDGHGLWQSAYADDVGLGFAYAAANPRCFGQAYNAVADEVVTWDQYVLRTAAAIGAPMPRLVHLPTDFLLAVDPKRYVVLDEIFRFHGVYSNTKLKRDVPEFRLAMSYEEGVRRTVAWIDRHKPVPALPADTADNS